ncbi:MULTISPECIES: UpxY family transcription antiterminator [unclassified Spirosoma]|uniref:UpxY family transcription antiterminator n=1 Tax=unclassified Spirosoma TaxID=2621999 RepID=UPI000968F3A3|nr:MULTISPECIES: UpxY family transcription antiterminator [unclassified Spirosoma]MBN8826701.1 UpxY family transcription antiterminator [Spirosoma sp.]OJW75064.1 MAG: antitermination protein NusG [Spirosoma sp. 48-14]
MPWFVLYTKPRNEKQVAERLQAMAIDVYCPLLKTKRKWSDRIKLVEEPLFRSYCFVNLQEHERARVFTIPGAVRYLFWLKKPAIVQDTEISAIKLMLNDVDHNAIQIASFSPGDRLTIGSGGFANTTGKVIKQQGKIVAIQLDALQLIIKVDISRTIVSK